MPVISDSRSVVCACCRPCAADKRNNGWNPANIRDHAVLSGSPKERYGSLESTNIRPENVRGLGLFPDILCYVGGGLSAAGIAVLKALAFVQELSP